MPVHAAIRRPRSPSLTQLLRDGVESTGEQWISIADKVALVAEETFDRISQVSRNLFHPLTVRLVDYSSDMKSGSHRQNTAGKNRSFFRLSTQRGIGIVRQLQRLRVEPCPSRRIAHSPEWVKVILRVAGESPRIVG